MNTMQSFKQWPHDPKFLQPWEKKMLETVIGKKRWAGNQHFLLLPQCFVLYETQKSLSDIQLNWYLQLLSIWTRSSDILMLVNPFPNKPWFLRVCSISLLKTLWEKEKLLVTSNFSFSHSVFYPFGELSAIFVTFEILVCKLFEFGRV